MAESTTIQTAIETAVSKPKSVSMDGMSKSAQSIPDLIAADKYLASKRASASGGLGIRLGRFIPPGH